ncbi:hypothetical protein [Massilia sp. DD77]|uniref:hypothetical protein n=1 Tax=Massilia sp. DD77 TaxID=3109349 RepID=UPI002FFF25C6
MPKKKNYISAATFEPPVLSMGAPGIRTATLVFSDFVGDSDRTHLQHTFALEEWMGRGIDAWVWGTLESLGDQLRSGTKSRSTIASVGKGMRKFFEFITEHPQPLVAGPSELVPLHITAYIEWLQQQALKLGWTTDTVRMRYQNLKSVVRQMHARGAVKAELGRLFPDRALPNGNKVVRGYSAFSDAELQRLAKAIKADLTDLHHGRLKLNPSEAIANRFLIVAMRTGINPIPLLEIKRDSLSPGLLPGTMRLRTVKHRGNQIQERTLVRGSQVEKPVLIPTDAVAVLELTLADTESLIAEAPKQLQNRVWLYRSLRSQEFGQVVCLSYSVMQESIKQLVHRRGLFADDGEQLQVNVSRLRKSFGKKAFRISDGDVVTTARMLGNSPRIADLNYLRVDEQIKADGAVFLGEEFTGRLRGGSSSPWAEPIKSADKTPVASCKDNLYGEHAPKDGNNYCDQFVMCLFCPSFAVVGEEDELWRLFSYQIFARHELSRLDKSLEHIRESVHVQRLIDLYRRAIPFIDQFTEQSFDSSLVKHARKKAELTLHPFWKFQLERSITRIGRVLS